MADETILITGECCGLDRPFEGGSPTCELTAGLTLLLLRDEDRHFYKAAHRGRIIYVPKHSSRLLRSEEIRSYPEIDRESQDLPLESSSALVAEFAQQEPRVTEADSERRGQTSRGRYCFGCGTQVVPGAAHCHACGAYTWGALQGTVAARTLLDCREPRGKAKTTAVLLAIFPPFCFATWLYTYREDGAKFWAWVGLNALYVFSLAAPPLGGLLVIMGVAFWVWTIVGVARRPSAWYESYNTPGSVDDRARQAA